MKIIKPTFEILEPYGYTLGDIWKQIERASRVCYKSEDKITDNSAPDFVNRMIKSKHYAMLEHGTVYLTFTLSHDRGGKEYGRLRLMHNRYVLNPYSRVNRRVIEGEYNADIVYVTTNYRYIIENGWLDDLEYLCAPTEWHEKRISVLFHTQIAISREFNRHRADSIAESSTRYCNYSKAKFDNEITINLPSWVEPDAITPDAMDKAIMQNKLMELANTWGNAEVKFPKEFTALDYWLLANTMAEYCYMGLIQQGWTAQQARTILPLDTNTDLVHTAFVSDWMHFFKLRSHGTTGRPHPDAQALAEPLLVEFIMREYITEDEYERKNT